MGSGIAYQLYHFFPSEHVGKYYPNEHICASLCHRNDNRVEVHQQLQLLRCAASVCQSEVLAWKVHVSPMDQTQLVLQSIQQISYFSFSHFSHSASTYQEVTCIWKNAVDCFVLSCVSLCVTRIVACVNLRLLLLQQKLCCAVCIAQRFLIWEFLLSSLSSHALYFPLFWPLLFI